MSLKVYFESGSRYGARKLSKGINAMNFLIGVFFAIFIIFRSLGLTYFELKLNGYICKGPEKGFR
jgi:hypothetical protein